MIENTYYTIIIVDCGIVRTIRTSLLCNGRVAVGFWLATDGTSTDCLKSGCIVGRTFVILIIPLDGYVVA